jgi:hypothetical protein
MYGLWGEECYRRSATGRSGWSRGSSCVSPWRVSRADLQIKLKCFLGLTACYYPPYPGPCLQSSWGVSNFLFCKAVCVAASPRRASV